ncbi:hypothetical protein B4135_4116 [Caldibacillus debilis]|uniref:Uncharacterized protein n=1 Tax=Caldibacillus debilis TaxID=301148 RepID=A0A150L8Q1_9BACI|nr:hypothetical protein B4135_4116 [Caldibacillus debilis]
MQDQSGNFSRRGGLLLPGTGAALTDITAAGKNLDNTYLCKIPLVRRWVS